MQTRADHRDNSGPRLTVGPRLVFTRTHVMVIAVSVLTAMVLGFRLLFSHVESVRGFDDARDDQMTLFVAALAAAVCAGIWVRLSRRPKPTDFAPHE